MKLFDATSRLHKECWELLPWLANERLSHSDAVRIEAHLRDCEQCRSELAVQRRLRDALRAEDAVVLAPQASLQKLMHRIERNRDADRAAATELDPSEMARAPLRSERRGPSRVPRWFVIAASLQAAVIALLLLALGWQSQERMSAPRFATLTSPSTVPQGPVIRIVFDDGIEVREINELLRSIDAHIVGGPSSAGVFTLKLAGAHRSGEEVERIAAELRQDGRVRFSEPATAEIAGK